MKQPLDVTIVGGGMITNDLLLPAIYHLQRMGIVGEIRVCALSSGPLRDLTANPVLAEAFPKQQFYPFPALSEPVEAKFPELYREVIAAQPRR